MQSEGGAAQNKKGGKGGKKGKGGGGSSGARTEFVHTLNSTACAVPRIIVAILENFQQVRGGVAGAGVHRLEKPCRAGSLGQLS